MRKLAIVLGAMLMLGTTLYAKEPVDIPVLMYHHFDEREAQWSSVTVSPEKFKEDLLALKAADYTTISPDELVAYQEGNGTLPEKPIMITFDDGYTSNYTLAYPILKELNMKATMHVVGSSRGTTPGVTPHFSWEQAKEMYDSGLISIQSHTHDLHTEVDGAKGVMRRKNETVTEHKIRLKADLQRNKDDIEKYVGDTVSMIAYPYGAKDSYTDKLIEELGFKISLTVKENVGNTAQGLFSMPRINVPYNLSSEGVLKKINDFKLASNNN